MRCEAQKDITTRCGDILNIVGAQAAELESSADSRHIPAPLIILAPVSTDRFKTEAHGP